MNDKAVCGTFNPLNIGSGLDLKTLLDKVVFKAGYVVAKWQVGRTSRDRPHARQQRKPLRGEQAHLGVNVPERGERADSSFE